jgi:hypothetical protein
MSAPPQADRLREQSPAEDASAGTAGIRRQAVLRDLNEQIRRIAESFGIEEPLQLVCECERGDCLARLSVSPQDYEALRRFPTRFLTRTDHVSDHERVVQEMAGCVVVEKIGDAQAPSAQAGVIQRLSG